MNVTEYLGDDPVLYLDISSTCTGWTVARMDRRTKKAIITAAGVLWFDKEWPHGRKYKELQDFVLNVAYVRHRVNNIVAEGYMVNPKRAMGTLVIPEATGAIKATCFEAAPPMGFYLILPQSWRAALQIKKDPSLAGSSSWKIPTKNKIEKILGPLPEKLMSNITGKLRKTPYDLYDSLGICMGWLSKSPNDCTDFILKKGAISEF